MDYKLLHIPEDKFELGQNQKKDSFISQINTNEKDVNEINYEQFSDFLDSLISSDKIGIEINTISSINRFRDYMLQFYENKQEFKDISLFSKKKIAKFLIKHASRKFTFKIREASLTCIATFLALYPQFSDAFIYYDYIDILNDVFRSYMNEENKILLIPAYKGLGNLIHNIQTIEFEYNLFLIIINYKIIDFDNFIHSTSVFEPKDSICINYAISSIFRLISKSLIDESTCSLLNEEQIIQMLTVLNYTICSKINEETCSSNLHVYALSAIDLFVKSEIYDKNFRNNAIIQSQIHNTINRYFDVEGLIREKSMVLSIISTFYKLEIPDIYQLIDAIIPFLLYVIKTQEAGGIDVYHENRNPKHTQRSKNIKRICDAIKEILESPYCPTALLNFYKIDALNDLCSALDDTKKLKEKEFIIGIIALFAEKNANYLPMNEFFFTENCIEVFLQLLDGDNDVFNAQVIKAIFIIFDNSNINGKIDQMRAIFEKLNGIESLKSFANSEDKFISTYAIRSLEMVEIFPSW